MRKATQEELDALACARHREPATEDGDRLAGQRFCQRCPTCLGNYERHLRAMAAAKPG